MRIAQEYYTDLYNKDDILIEKIENYLEEDKILPLGEDERGILNKEITIEELRGAILRLKNNKTPGPDGLPGEIYKKLNEIVEPKLLEICYEAL